MALPAGQEDRWTWHAEEVDEIRRQLSPQESTLLWKWNASSNAHSLRKLLSIDLQKCQFETEEIPRNETEEMPTNVAGRGAIETASFSEHLPFDSTVVREDLTELQKIHLPSLLDSLEKRYRLESWIYTYMGSTLLAVNPYQSTSMKDGLVGKADIFDARVRRYYASLDGDTRRHGIPAHLFAIADNAYRNLHAEQRNQSIVISGESGAGKTKSAREVLRYIVEASREGHLPGRGSDTLVTKILESNPILEAFGNAKTSRNDNSSRFGKYLALHFHADRKQIQGASMQIYLLETSRVTSQSKGDRNFHIFYQFLSGIESEDERKQLRLLEPTKYRYLGGEQGTFTTAYEDGHTEAKEWERVVQGMAQMGLQEHVPSIKRLLSFVLLLGNIEFEDETVEAETCSKITEASRQVLDDAAALIRCSATVLENAIRIKRLDRDQKFIRLDSRQASNNRDALAKMTYNHLVLWISLFKLKFTA